jgi:hypothetical protein
MLKRPVEKHWKFHQPPAPFPQCPTSSVMLAPSGQGKTTTIVSLILGPYSKVYESIHVYSPSVFIDSAWEPVISFAKSLKDCTFNADWDEAGLIEIMDEQKKKVKQLKDGKTDKPIPQILVIVDDWADTPMLHSSTNILTTLMIRGRHLGVSCWVSSQHLRAISPVIRNNVKFLCVWRLRNAKEIAALMEELSALYPIPVLREMYEKAISDAPYSFWTINMMVPKEEMMMVRFEDRMVVE